MNLRDSKLGRFTRRHEHFHKAVHATWCRALNKRAASATSGGSSKGAGTTGTFMITVKDDVTNLAIAFASVTGIQGVGTTDPSGIATFYDVPVGTYTVTVQATNYLTQTTPGIIITAGATSTLTAFLHGNF